MQACGMEIYGGKTLNMQGTTPYTLRFFIIIYLLFIIFRHQNGPLHVFNDDVCVEIISISYLNYF